MYFAFTFSAQYLSEGCGALSRLMFVSCWGLTRRRCGHDQPSRYESWPRGEWLRLGWAQVRKLTVQAIEVQPTSAQTRTNMKISSRGIARVRGSKYSALGCARRAREQASSGRTKRLLFQAAAIAQSSAGSALGPRQPRIWGPRPQSASGVPQFWP